MNISESSIVTVCSTSFVMCNAMKLCHCMWTWPKCRSCPLFFLASNDTTTALYTGAAMEDFIYGSSLTTNDIDSILQCCYMILVE